MDKITLVSSLIIFGTAGLIAGVVYHELCWWRRMRCLEQQLLTQQQLIELLEAEIHNGALQRLAFLIRELQIHELSQQELLQHLRSVYQDVQAALSIDKSH
ncbi:MULTISPECIES: hypothetical protein [unclassified Microcoleus]|uniref:hypothetical protein n=1 Tax=unclassified Microcoleus TaxID=2642155 RepID=UPI002FD3B88D